MIAFHTPPTDDSGIAHVLEHSVLLRLAEVSSKEPFVELLKGSLQTFLNAFTANDRTMYPVASRNDKDFSQPDGRLPGRRLLSAAPRGSRDHDAGGLALRGRPEVGGLSYNGVVYNEMKGALSSPGGSLPEHREQPVSRGHLSPQLGRRSAVIPTLTPAKFAAFHKRYYHPSNAFVFLYGNGDVGKHLAFLDREYLRPFDRRPSRRGGGSAAAVRRSRRSGGPSTRSTAEDRDRDKTFLSINYVVGASARCRTCTSAWTCSPIFCSIRRRRPCGGH